MKRRENRRQFLKQATAIGAGAWIVCPSLIAAERSPNEQINVACIGVGGKGGSDTDHAGNYGNIVALCDIDDQTLNGKGEKFPDARKFRDFRKLLEEMEKQIDAVTVSTPDHTHAAAALMALRLKKHVYCQKPLTWSIREARMLREAAKQYGVCTQMGNQGVAHDGSRQSIEVIRSGVLGDIHTVYAWTDRPTGWWKQAPDFVSRPAPADAVPPHIHWDLWLGPAPARPYADPKLDIKRKIYHPFGWRGWRDFGTGALGDMACHLWNIPFIALGLKPPVAVAAENSEVNPETYQQWATVTFDFPAANGRGPVKFIWQEGIKDGKQNLPPVELFHGAEVKIGGFLVVGKKGTFYCPNSYGTQQFLLPKKDFDGYQPPAPKLPRLVGPGNNDDLHKKEWFEAIKAGKPEIAMSNFEHAGLLTESVLLGNVAIRAGKRIEWDSAAMKISNAPEAQQYLSREYRQGWSL